MKNENGVTRKLEKAVFPYRWRWNGVFWGLANEKLVQNGAEWRTGKNEKTGRFPAGFLVLERLRQRAQNCLAAALQNGSFGVATVQHTNKEKRRCIAVLHALQRRFILLCKNQEKKFHTRTFAIESKAKYRDLIGKKLPIKNSIADYDATLIFCFSPHVLKCVFCRLKLEAQNG